MCAYNLLTQRACSRSANNHVARNKREIRIGISTSMSTSTSTSTTSASASTSTYMSLWTLEETKALIAVWGQANVQSQLDSVVRNRTIYQHIAKELADLGLNKTWEQCKTKIKNMTQKYNKV